MKKFCLISVFGFLITCSVFAQSSIQQVGSQEVPIDCQAFIIPEFLQSTAPLSFTKIYKQSIVLKLNNNEQQLPENLLSLFDRDSAIAEIYYFYADEKFIKVIGNDVANELSHGDISNIFETDPLAIKNCGAEFNDCISRANAEFNDCVQNQSGNPGGLAVCVGLQAVKYITCAGLCAGGVVVGAWDFAYSLVH